MTFDTDNLTVTLCARGMELEGQGKADEALSAFQQAWDQAEIPWEKSIAAHYVARHQPHISDRLHWNKTALEFGLKADPREMELLLPSLYLNIGKDYEDLKDTANALLNYKAAHSFASSLPEDGYGRMIRMGIANGLERIRKFNNQDEFHQS